MIIFTSLNPQHPIGAESDSGFVIIPAKKRHHLKVKGTNMGVNKVAI